MILVRREKGLNRANRRERGRDGGKTARDTERGRKTEWWMVMGWVVGGEKDTVGEIAGERERKREWWHTEGALR